MANAMVTSIDDTQMPNTPNITWTCTVVYAGSDVPGNFWRTQIQFSVVPTVNLAGLGAALKAAVQATAATQGFTVGTGSILVFSFQTL